MGVKSYQRGTMLVQRQIARDYGLPDPYYEAPPTPRPADWGTKAFQKALKKAKGILSYRKMRDKPLPAVDDLADMIQSDTRVGRQTALSAATEALGLKPNPAPGYQSYAWTTQDWRVIKALKNGKVDASEKCGGPGNRTASQKVRLCLPIAVVRALQKTAKGRRVLHSQALKKVRAPKGKRVPWHPMIRELHAKLEKRTVKDRKKNPKIPAWMSAATVLDKIAEANNDPGFNRFLQRNRAQLLATIDRLLQAHVKPAPEHLRPFDSRWDQLHNWLYYGGNGWQASNGRGDIPVGPGRVYPMDVYQNWERIPEDDFPSLWRSTKKLMASMPEQPVIVKARGGIRVDPPSLDDPEDTWKLWSDVKRTVAVAEDWRLDDALSAYRDATAETRWAAHYQDKTVYVYGDGAVWKVPRGVSPTRKWWNTEPAPLRGPKQSIRTGRWLKLPKSLYQTEDGNLDSFQPDVEVLRYDELF